MPSETESIVVQLVRALNDAPDGHLMQWRMIERLDGATADAGRGTGGDEADLASDPESSR